MNELRRKGAPVIGVIFLTLGVFKFLRGEDWVVWIILGVLFGGLAVSGRNKASD